MTLKDKILYALALILTAGLAAPVLMAEVPIQLMAVTVQASVVALAWKKWAPKG